MTKTADQGAAFSSLALVPSAGWNHGVPRMSASFNGLPRFAWINLALKGFKVNGFISESLWALIISTQD